MNNAIRNPIPETTFSELMQRSYKKVYNLAYRLSGDKSDAEDLTQEAFFRAYRSFHGYEGDRPFENWIFRIVTRLFLDLVRNRKRRVQAVSYDVPVWSDGNDEAMLVQTADKSPNPEEILLHSAVNPDLAAALDTLKPDQRTLVLLADVEQMSYNDIADVMQIPVGTVRSRLHRAHKKLRALLEASERARDKARLSSTAPSPCYGCPA